MVRREGPPSGLEAELVADAAGATEQSARVDAQLLQLLAVLVGIDRVGQQPVGLLDLVVVRPVTPARALVLLRAVRAGRHTAMPEVEVRRATRVRVEGPTDVLAHGDGEALAPLPLTVQVANANLQVIVPALA